MSQEAIGIGLIGCGTVGRGVARLLDEQADVYAQKLGRPLRLCQVLVRDASIARGVAIPKGALTIDPEAFFGDQRVSIVVEVAGGVDPIGQYVRRALTSGRHVVTANKSLLAAQGPQLFSLAREHDRCIAFEASCGGGIPILAALKFGLGANRVQAVYGVLNGTCNYILTQMTEHGATYAAALKEAQDLGFAEADPTLDVSGADAAQKLAIIASLAFGGSVPEDAVACEGIDALELDDLFFAAELGYQVKLLAIGELHEDGLVLRVAPCFVHAEEPLAQVRNAFNALSVFSHAAGHTMFYGHGAGQMPTASAVVGDILNVAGGWYPQAFASMRIWPDQRPPSRIVSGDEVETRFYLRVSAKDQPGVMARIAAVLGDEGISISAVLQHESDDGTFVPVIITTHLAREGAIKAARKKIAGLDAVRDEPVCIRIVDLPEG